MDSHQRRTGNDDITTLFIGFGVFAAFFALVIHLTFVHQVPEDAALLNTITEPGPTYCLCKDGIGEKELQTSIDYACGVLKDCTPIQEKGACYQPNTVKSHCDWAVNTYFQRSNQVSGSCDFSGTATTSPNPPSTVVTGCIFPSSPQSARTIPTNEIHPF